MEEQDFKVSRKQTKFDKNSNTIRKMWEQIAARPSEFDMEIIDALKSTIHSDNPSNLGYNAESYVSTNSEDKYGCYGDKLYLVMREKIIKFKTPSARKINLLIGCVLNDSTTVLDSSKEKEKTQINNKDKHSKKKDIQPSKAEVDFTTCNY